MKARLKFAWEYWVLGRHRRPPIATPPDDDYPTPDSRLLGFLVDMYRAHGAEAVQMGHWVCIDRGRLFTRAAHVDHRRTPSSLILQVDFITKAHTGQHVIESFAGIGDDVVSALMDACCAFQESTFHVLFATLLDRPCDHSDVETWTVAGKPRKVTLGRLFMRGQPPPDFWPPVFEGFQKLIEQCDVPMGLHWVRLFYSSFGSDNPVVEVLIDNDRSEPLQLEARGLPWPASEDVYTARLFFTLQDP